MVACNNSYEVNEKAQEGGHVQSRVNVFRWFISHRIEAAAHGPPAQPHMLLRLGRAQNKGGALPRHNGVEPRCLVVPVFDMVVFVKLCKTYLKVEIFSFAVFRLKYNFLLRD